MSDYSYINLNFLFTPENSRLLLNHVRPLIYFEVIAEDMQLLTLANNPNFLSWIMACFYLIQLFLKNIQGNKLLSA